MTTAYEAAIAAGATHSEAVEANRAAAVTRTEGKDPIATVTGIAQQAVATREARVGNEEGTHPTSPTQSIEIPTEPDSPGGQIATVNGQEVYIAGSTMREELGFETPEQYIHAQKTGAGQVAKEGWVGPLKGGEAAVRAVSVEHGISEPEARRLIALAWETKGKAPELQSLTEQQRQGLLVASRRYDPWAIAPESVKSGDIPGVAPTREQQEQIAKEQVAAAEVLKKADMATGSMDKGLRIKAEAYASDDPKIQQAVRDLTRSEEQYKTERAKVQALSGAPVESIKVAGLGADVTSKVYDLAKLRGEKAVTPGEKSGVYSIDFSKMPSSMGWEQVSGALGFAGMKLGVEHRQAFEEIRAPKPTPEVSKDKSEQAALEILEKYATGRTMLDEYPHGGAPFEAYGTAPKTYDIVTALYEGVPEATLLSAGFKPEQLAKAKVDLVQYKTLLTAQGIINKYADEKGNISYYGLRKAIDEGATATQLRALGFSQEAIDTAKLPPPQDVFLAEYEKFHPKPEVMTKHRGTLTPSEEAELHKAEPVWYTEAAKEYNKLYKKTTPLPESHLFALPETGVMDAEPIQIDAYTMAALRQLPAKFGITTLTKLAEPTMGVETIKWWEPPKDIAVAWLWAGAPGAGTALKFTGSGLAKSAKVADRIILGKPITMEVEQVPFRAIFGPKAVASTGRPATFIYGPEGKVLDVVYPGTVGAGGKFYPASSITEAKAASLVKPYPETTEALAKTIKIASKSDFEQALAYQQQLRVLPATSANMEARTTIANKIDDYINSLTSSEAKRLAEVQAKLRVPYEKAEYWASQPPNIKWTQPKTTRGWRPVAKDDIPGTAGKEFIKDTETGKLYVRDLPKSAPKQVAVKTKTALEYGVKSPKQVATEIPLQYPYWKQTPSGFWLLRFSGLPTTKTILGEDIVTKFVIPSEPAKQVPVPLRPTTPITIPIISPSPIDMPVKEWMPMPSTPYKYTPELEPTYKVITPTEPIIRIMPEPATYTIPVSVPALIKTTLVPPKTIAYEPPPVRKRPPPIIVPPLLPNLPILGGGSISRHGLHSTYVKRMFNIPELVVYLPTWEGLKSPSIDSKLWRKFGTLDEGVELLGEEEFEETPFGRKAVRPVVARAKIAVGAKRTAPSLKAGITPAEEYYIPITKKETKGKITGKRQTVYSRVAPNDIGITEWVG